MYRDLLRTACSVWNRPIKGRTGCHINKHSSDLIFKSKVEARERKYEWLFCSGTFTDSSYSVNRGPSDAAHALYRLSHSCSENTGVSLKWYFNNIH